MPLMSFGAAAEMRWTLAMGIGLFRPSHSVMPGLVPGIHVFLSRACEDVDGRDKPGHDDLQ